MSGYFKGIGTFILCIVALLAIIWLVQGNDFFIYKVFAPARAKVERQVFEQTPSYVKGMVQDLEKAQAEYVAEKDPEARAAMATTILHRAGGFNLEDPDVPASLRAFISKLKRERGLE